MAEKKRKFFRNEEGAVTIDWVVITAAIIGLVIAIIPLVEAPVGTVTGLTQTALDTADATTTFGS